MTNCYVVMQRLRLTGGYMNAPVSVHLDQEDAQQEVDLLNAQEPLQAWINELPFHHTFNIEGTETGRASGVPSREEAYEHLRAHSLNLQSENQDA